MGWAGLCKVFIHSLDSVNDFFISLDSEEFILSRDFEKVYYFNGLCKEFILSLDFVQVFFYRSAVQRIYIYPPPPISDKCVLLLGRHRQGIVLPAEAGDIVR